MNPVAAALWFIEAHFDAALEDLPLQEPLRMAKTALSLEPPRFVDGKPLYGVCCNGDDAGNYDYVCGVVKGR